MKYFTKLCAFAAILVCTACASTPLSFDASPIGPDEEIVGPATGSSTGFMLLQFIPINQNARFEKAYNQALKSSGGTRLTQMTISERWFWAYIGNGYNFRVHGVAVRPRQAQP